MAEPVKKDGPVQTSSSAAAKPASKPPNPVFRMMFMGLPNLPKKLPSRNWLIFWSVLFSFTAAKTYDSRQKKAAQKKWCDLVAHISQEKLGTSQLPRKLTVFLSAVPGDSIGPSRQYFKDYIKPILVAASMDYEVIEGRKEGDVRYGTAEQIRRLRRKKGEQGASDEQPEMDAAMAIDLMRERMLVQPEPGVRGDLVLGRHTWKEYIRGIHEGWLGPLDEPPEPVPEPSIISPTSDLKTDNSEAPASSETIESSTEEPKPTEEAKEEKKEEKKKPYPPPAYLTINEYSVASLSPHIPTLLEPSEAIYQQHLLGFLKTPQRIYNWLNRRSLQDQIGRQVAAVVLASYRPYQHEESFASPSFISDNATPSDSSSLATKAPENDLSDSTPVQTSATHEQQSLLTQEEVYWHKSVHRPKSAEDKSERLWNSEIVLDPRIAQRMRRFELDPEQEERAGRIGAGLEAGWAVPVQDLRQQKTIVGDLDQDSMA